MLTGPRGDFEFERGSKPDTGKKSNVELSMMGQKVLIHIQILPYSIYGVNHCAGPTYSSSKLCPFSPLCDLPQVACSSSVRMCKIFRRKRCIEPN